MRPTCPDAAAMFVVYEYMNLKKEDSDAGGDRDENAYEKHVDEDVDGGLMGNAFLSDFLFFFLFCSFLLLSFLFYFSWFSYFIFHWGSTVIKGWKGYFYRFKNMLCGLKKYSVFGDMFMG
jgi:magnesium-transporting ATPase (P-type)